MAFKIPLVQTKSLSKGYFEGLPNFVWSDVKDKDEIGKGSFGSVMKGNYIPSGKVVVVKRFFGGGDSHLYSLLFHENMRIFKEFRLIVNMLRALILLTRKCHNVIKHSFNENIRELDYLLISY